jgi:hypothetical protein
MHKVPPPLPWQAKRPSKPAKSVHVTVGHHRRADVIARTSARLVDERLGTHPSTITYRLETEDHQLAADVSSLGILYKHQYARAYVTA